MPDLSALDWVLLVLITAFVALFLVALLVVVVLLVVGAAFAVALAFQGLWWLGTWSVTWVRRAVRRTPAPAAVTESDGGRVWVACHSTLCGHMSVPHTRTGAGDLVCQQCSRTTPAVPR
ncbi:hypothetical protein [Streptomyces sp. NRRL F-5135]|uniref:hypothetical protein n=1 Tax=Streptomyces sp. NRRL F-5135 TaxID=1463858 RepID=UPI0004C7F147|nr:hypothetical protein [Streptomyces sp. NRRL F-5135]